MNILQAIDFVPSGPERAQVLLRLQGPDSWALRASPRRKGFTPGLLILWSVRALQFRRPPLAFFRQRSQPLGGLRIVDRVCQTAARGRLLQ